MKNLALTLLFVTCLFTSCDDDQNEADTTLSGNSFTLTVDRVATSPKVQFPSDALTDSDYIASSEEILHEVSFSNDGQTTTIDQGTFSGTKTTSDLYEHYFELISQGDIVCGRLIIWQEEEDFSFELTLYGAGLPILKSERGIASLLTEK